MNEEYKAYLEALEADPNNREAFQKLAESYQERNNWRSLLNLYDKYPAMAKWPQLVSTLAMVAENEEKVERKSATFHICGQICEQKLGRPDEAIKFYQVAVKTWSGRAESFDAARGIYLAMNNIKMVIKLLLVEEQSTPSDKRRVEVLKKLVIICRQVLKDEKNAENYEKKAAAIEKKLAAEANVNAEDTNKETKAEDAKAEEVVEDAKAEEVVEDAKAEEVVEDAKNEDVVEDAKAEDVVEDAKAEEVVEDAKAEEVVEDAKNEEVVEETKAEEVVEDAKAEDVVEDAKAEEVVEEAKNEEVVEETKAEEVVEDAKAEEVAEDAKAEEVVEEAKAEDVVEDAKAEDVVEDAKAEDVVEDAKAEDVVEDAKAEDVVEDAKTEEVVEDAKAEDVVEDAKAEEVVEDAKTEEVVEDAKAEEVVAEVKAEAVKSDVEVSSLVDCCESIYRLADTQKTEEINDVIAKALELVNGFDDASTLCDALDEAGCDEILANTLSRLSTKFEDETSKRLLTADWADVLDLRLSKRQEALEIATPIAEGSDRASYKAKAVVAGDDKGKLQELANNMLDLLKKLRRTPDEVPFMSDLAHIYSERLGSLKDAEEQYKRIKLAEPKNCRMLKFYCRYYESTGDWQRVLSSLQTLKGAVAGSYRELTVSRQIARISEEKLNNPGKAVNVWNQMLKEGSYVDVARKELIALYQRMQKWQPLLDIYKNDLEALAPENKEESIAILKKSIAIYDEQLHNEAMVLKLYHQILDIDPDNQEAVDALIERYEASKRWNDLLKILNQKAQTAKDVETRVSIYYRIAEILSVNLGNVAKSIEPLNMVIEIDPTQTKALRQLHEFYEQRNNWASLYDIIEKEAAVAKDGEKISLYKRQAEIAESNLRSTEKAIASWETMSSCLEDPSEALEELVRLYKKEGNFEALLKVYERAIEHSHSESERADNMERIAELYLEHLNDRDKGIATLRSMLEIEEGKDQALVQMTQIFRDAEDWNELTKLYLDLGQAEQLYELLDLTAGDLDDESTQIELYERMAAVAKENLNDDDKAIEAFEKILDVDSTHEKTARSLLNFYLDRSEYAKAIDAIQIIIAWTSDSNEKIDKHVQIANLYEQELSDLDNAANWYAKVVALSPDKKEYREHFEELVQKNESPALLYDVYSNLIKTDSLDDESRISIHRSLAQTCEKKLDKTQDAITSWEACLAANDKDSEAIDSLSGLYEQACEWTKLLDIYNRKLELTDAPDEICALSFKRAELLIGQLENLEEAEKSYQRILEIDDSNTNALHGLKAIYDTTENWEKLVDVLKKEQAAATDNRIDVTFELAETERLHLNQTSEAIQLYASILDEDSTHERTISTLETLIKEGVEPSRLAAILEPVYERAGEHAKQCEALEIRLKSLDDSEKLPVLWQVYDLRHDVLNDDAAAFDASVRLFGLTADDERIWDNLESLAKAGSDESRWTKVSELYASVAPNEDHSDEWRYKLLRRRAMIVEEQLSNESESIALWEQVHANVPEDLEAIKHLETLYKNSSSFDKLVKLYEFETNLSDFSDEDRVRIYLETAQIYEDILENSTEAIRVYRSVLEIDSSKEEALSALERLYTSNEMWSDLAALYEEELNIYSDHDRVTSVRTKLAEVSDSNLANYKRAIECYESLLSEEHSDDTVASANALLIKLTSVEDEKAPEYRASLCEILEPIFVEKSGLNNLISLLKIKLTDTDDSYEKVELNRRIAGILKSDLDDEQGAFEALNAALKIDVTDESLRSDYEALATKLGRPADIISLYEESLKSVDDDTLKHDLLKRVASIYENDLQDTAHAIDSYRKMLEIDEMDGETLNALESLYTNDQNWSELINILKSKAEIGSGDEKVEILRKMATINGDCINDTKAAIASYREILDNVSDDRDALNALESLYTQCEDWENLSENYGIKLQLSSDDEEKRSILKEMASIQENKLKHYDEATQLHVQILDIFPEDEEALDSLERLYESQEAYDDLAEILRKKLELHKDSELANTIEYRLGQVNQTKLDSVEMAIDHYKAILERKPEHTEAHDALRGLLENEDYKLDASRVLESVYDKTEQNEKLAEILEIQLGEESDPYGQVELLKRIASIHQDKLTDYAAAFKDYARILKLSQDEEYVVQLESLSDILNNTSELVDVYKEVVKNVYEPDQQVSFNNKIADNLRNNLNDEAQSEGYYRAALEVQSDDSHALNALDEIYTSHESWKDLLGILEAKLDASSDPEAQLPLLYRTAEVQEAKCQAHDDAISTYQRILEIENGSAKARESLAAIYEQQEMWTELSDLLRAEIDDAADQDASLSLKFKLAKLQNEKLQDAFESIQTLQDILNTKADHEDARTYLENLFEAGDNTVAIAEILEPIYKAQNEWTKLIHSLEVRAKQEEDEFSRAQILDEIAKTWSENLDDNSKALETYGRILMLQPTDSAIQNKVETLAAQTSELQTWADLYTRVLDENRVEDYTDKRVIMLSLAKLQAERMDNKDKACELCNQMLEEEPEELEAYDILEWCYAQKHDYKAMLELWMKKSDIVQDQDDKLNLMLRIATLQEEYAHDEVAACKTYQQMIEIDQNAPSAATSLERLLRKTEQYAELADFYRQQSDYASSDDARVEYMHKLGVVLSRELHNDEEAVEVLGNALAIQPSSTACKRAVETMLANTEATSETAEIRSTMATMLEPLYTDDEWSKLARVLDVLIDVSDDADSKVSLYMRQAALFENHDSHPKRAFDTYAKAFTLAPSTADAKDKLEAIAPELDNAQYLADVYAKAIEVCEDDYEKISLYERLAEIWNSDIKDATKAAECYEAILALDESHLKSICALETIYANAQMNDKSVVVLKKHAELVSNMIDQKDLYYRIAELQEKSLNQSEEAIKTYQTILDLDSEDQIALDALETLYTNSENWEELIVILKRKIDAATETADRINLSITIAKVYRSKLDDVDSAIDNYIQALNEDQQNLNVLSALEELYTETKRYDDLLETIQSKVNYASQENNAELKQQNELKMARILIENTDEKSRAIEVLSDILRDNAQCEEAISMLNGLLENEDLVNDISAILMPIYKDMENHKDYLRVCERQIEVCSDDFEKRSLYMDAAAVADEKLSDADKAFGFISAALLANPTDDEIIEKAECIANNHECYAKLTDLCDKVIADANDPDASTKLSLIAAKYYENKLNNTDKTIEQFERVIEIDALHETALENLHRLYKQTAQSEKLADVLQKRIDAGAQPLNDIRYELVEIKLDSEPAEALEILKQILWDDAENENAISAMEKLLAHKELTLDIAEFLEPHYNKTSESEKLVSLLKAKVELTEDTTDAVALLKQIAKLELDVLHNEKDAFDTYVTALAKDPSDAEILPTLESIAENLGLWKDLTDAYAKSIEASQDDTDKISLYAKQANIMVDHLNAYDDAKSSLNAIIEIDNENIEALRSLEKIYAHLGDSENLLNTKAHLADLIYESDAQKQLLYDCADIALNTLVQDERGIAFLEKIVEIDDREITAINTLLQLYASVGSFDKYVDLLNKKLLNVSDDQERFPIYLDLAKMNEEKLNDPAAAIEAYQNALAIKRDERIYSALENLYKAHEQYQDLDDLYLSQLDIVSDNAQKAAIKLKRAHIAETQFNDDMQAIDLLKDALSDDPTSTDAFNKLDEIYSKNDNFDELYELLKEQKEKATSADLVLTFNIRLAKLAATHLGDPEKAIESLQEVLQSQPHNLEAVNSLIEIHEQQKSYDLALGMLQHKLSCLSTKEEQAEVYCHVARLLKKANWEVSQIEGSYNAALTLNPKNEEALNALLDIAKESKNISKQLELLNVRADNTDDVDAKNEILMNIADIASSDNSFAKNAADALAKVYASKQDDIELGEKLVNAYIKADMSEQAKPVLDCIIDSLNTSKQPKRLPPFYILKGKMLKQSGDIDGARAAFEAANAIDKNNIPNNLELGILQYESGDYEKALKTMQTLLLHQMNVKDKETKTNIFYYLGMLRLKTNDPNRAKDMFNRALGVDPNHAPTKEAMATL